MPIWALTRSSSPRRPPHDDLQGRAEQGRVPRAADPEHNRPRFGEPTMRPALDSDSVRVEQVAGSSSATAHDVRDLVFTFYQETWADAVGPVKFMTGPRLLATLMSEASVRRLLVANPYRSAPIRWARRLYGQRPVSFPADSRCALVEPRRLRRRDPTTVRALERVYDAYDRILEGAAAGLGAERPAVI